MIIKTRVFGEIEAEDNKILEFPNGIIGFPDMRKFIILFDSEKGNNCGIKWLQSLDEPEFALPVMDPLLVKEDYNPIVEDELIGSIGTLDEESLFVLVAVNVPSDLSRMSVNLQAPLIINLETRKGCQIIIENEGCPIKYLIYDILQKKKVEK